MIKNEDATNNNDVEEILKSEPMIGYKEPLFHCKEHPKVQNINYEEIKHHLQHSKDHRPK